MTDQSAAQGLLDFVRACPSMLHTTAAISRRLEEAGFAYLPEGEAWRMEPGGRYYTSRNNSSVIALKVGADLDSYHFQLAAAHGDSPCFKVKAVPELAGPGDYLRLDVEAYGGMIDHTWLDRPLGVAGRALVREGDRVESRLFATDRDVAIIPSVAIHLNREGGRAPELNRAVDLCALCALELPALLAVPAVMVATAAAGLDVTAGLTLAVAVLAVGLLFASFEASRPPLRQLMPTAVLAATAAAGRVLFAPIPDVKPVSAIAIVAGAALGRRSGFVVGAVAALVSNFFFGQGSWTSWQMYAWGLVGYLGGVLSDHGALERAWALYAWGFVSALMYGAILNGYYVLGFVRPLTWPAVAAAYAAGAPLDIVHGIATAGFLAAIWLPWGRAIRRVVAKYDL